MLNEKQNEVLSVKADSGKELIGLEKEIKFIRDQVKDKERNVDIIREQLDEQSLKCKALVDSNVALTRTLR